MYRVFLRDDEGKDITIYETKSKPFIGEYVVTIQNDIYEIEKVALMADVGKATGWELVVCKVKKKHNDGLNTRYLKISK